MYYSFVVFVFSRSKMDIRELPLEILQTIFDYLDAMDLYRCSKVSRWFRKLSMDEYFWQNIQILPKKTNSTHFAEFIGCRFFAIPTKLIAFVINNGCTFLTLSVYEYQGKIDNTFLPEKCNLKHLKLHHLRTPLPKDPSDSFTANQELFLKLVNMCESLTKLAINGEF